MEDKEKKEKDITKYFYKMFIVFIIIDLAITFLPEVVTTFISSFKYGEDIINEIFYALFALIVMLLFKNSYVFSDKQEKFGKSIMLGLPLILYSVGMFAINVTKMTSFSIGNFINAIILCALVGVTEEFLCRGWLQNEFMERFGDDKRNIITSIFLSALIFGFMHISDILVANQSVVTTFIEIATVTSFGFLLGSVYYKTKNIWSVIFLHAIYYFSTFVSEINQVRECTYSIASTNINILNTCTTLLLCCFFILSSIIVIKKTNYPDKKASRSKKAYSKLLTTVILICASLFIPYEMFVEGYDEYKVCYTYNEIEIDDDYTTHYPLYDKYIISKVNNIASLFIEEETGTVEHYIIDEINIIIELENNTLKLTNVNLNQEIVLSEINKISRMEVLENENEYQIVLLVNEEDTSKIYFSNFIKKDELSNSSNYLEDASLSFKEFDTPIIDEVGYITILEDSEKYPYFISKNKDKFVIKDSEIYLMEK